MITLLFTPVNAWIWPGKEKPVNVKKKMQPAISRLHSGCGKTGYFNLFLHKGACLDFLSRNNNRDKLLFEPYHLLW